MAAILARARDLLTGEPVRAITWGAVVVVWLVFHIAFALGYVAQPPAFDVIAAAVSGAIVALNEILRSIVFSPNTVAAIQAGAAVNVPPPV